MNNDRPYTKKELEDLEKLKEALKDAVPFFRISDYDDNVIEDTHEDNGVNK